jgi:hypothetical protein
MDPKIVCLMTQTAAQNACHAPPLNKEMEPSKKHHQISREIAANMACARVQQERN